MAQLVSGTGGPGYYYGMWIYNKWGDDYPGHLNYLTKYTSDTTIYFDNYKFKEYNTLNDNMFNNQLGLYKIVTSFNWAGLVTWKI